MSPHDILLVFEFVMLIFAFSVHEAAHAWMANRLGDPTAMMLGRITLNPIKHIDPWGSLLLPIWGLTHGGWMMGWAKPCPVTPRNFRKYKRDDILVTIAGPVVNLLVAIVSLLVLIVLKHLSADGALAIYTLTMGGLPQDPNHPILTPLTILAYVGILVNLSLFVFNLFPVPPLDGSRVLRHYLPYNALKVYDSLSWYGLLVLFVLVPLLTGINLFGMLFDPLMRFFDLLISAV